MIVGDFSQFFIEGRLVDFKVYFIHKQADCQINANLRLVERIHIAAIIVIIDSKIPLYRIDTFSRSLSYTGIITQQNT